MLDLTGMWISIGVLCAAVFSLVVFAMYKQLFGVIELPERKLEAVVEPPSVPPASTTQMNATSDEVEGATNGANQPLPYVYEQSIQVETST